MFKFNTYTEGVNLVYKVNYTVTIIYSQPLNLKATSLAFKSLMSKRLAMTNLLMLLFFFIFTYNSIIHDGYLGTKRLLQKIENKNWNYFIKNFFQDKYKKFSNFNSKTLLSRAFKTANM